MTRFLAIDFETADEGPDSACAIGLVLVENGRIIEEVVHLIRPPRERMRFTYIHGITWEHVVDKLTFGQLWPSIAYLFDNIEFLAAHNSSFDKRVLEACLGAHGLPTPSTKFKCTVQIARKAFQIYPTKLSNVCKVLGIDLNHHEALSDARACAQIILRANLKEDESPAAPRYDQG